MKRLFGIILCVLLSGCSFFRHDLVEEGVYQVDASNFCGHALVVRAWKSGGKLVVKGRDIDLPYSAGLPADARVSLLSSDGVEIASNQAHFRRQYRHRGRSYVYFQTEFEQVPSPRALIRVRNTSVADECRSRK